MFTKIKLVTVLPVSLSFSNLSKCELLHSLLLSSEFLATPFSPLNWYLVQPVLQVQRWFLSGPCTFSQFVFLFETKNEKKRIFCFVVCLSTKTKNEKDE